MGKILSGGMLDDEMDGTFVLPVIAGTSSPQYTRNPSLVPYRTLKMIKIVIFPETIL